MIFSPSLSRLFSLAVVLVVLAGFGCGSDSDRSRVTGTVSYNGEPVDDGGIAFMPAGEGTASFRATGEIRDGRYDLDYKRGPAPGNYRVEIYWNKKTGRILNGPKGATKDERAQAIPAKYNEKSELRAEVKPGANTFNFDLKP